MFTLFVISHSNVLFPLSFLNLIRKICVRFQNKSIAIVLGSITAKCLLTIIIWLEATTYYPIILSMGLSCFTCWNWKIFSFNLVNKRVNNIEPPILNRKPYYYTIWYVCVYVFFTLDSFWHHCVSLPNRLRMEKLSRNACVAWVIDTVDTFQWRKQTPLCLFSPVSMNTCSTRKRWSTHTVYSVYSHFAKHDLMI